MHGAGKKECDAHEWEGACEGRLLEPDYDFALAKGQAEGQAQMAMGAAHNKRWAPKKFWSYGPEFKKGVCAQNSTRTPSATAANGIVWIKPLPNGLSSPDARARCRFTTSTATLPST